MKIDIKDEELINHLYFDKMYSYSQLIEHFNGKYTYAIIRQVIHNRLEKEREKDYGNTSKTIRWKLY